MPKTILIAYSGTGQHKDKKDKRRDNPGLICEILDREKYPASEQVHFYITGIGTDQKTFTGKKFDQIKAYTFPKKVREGYKHLCKNYEPGDRIILTGFSRGAALARSLAGMVRNVGLLKRDYVSKSRINEAYQAYISEAGVDDAAAVEFRNTYSHFDGVKINCLAVFDTVLAWDMDGFHDLHVSKMVEVFRHAVASDERRADFDWTPATSNPYHTDSEQCLFPGAHSDIGGSYQHRGLTQGPLLWIIEAMAKAGLKMPKDYVSYLKKTQSLPPVHISDNDSSGDEFDIDEQRMARVNPWDKQHYPEKEFLFRFRGEITRSGFEDLTDVVIDKSVQKREEDPHRDYKSPLSVETVRRITENRKRYARRVLASDPDVVAPQRVSPRLLRTTKATTSDPHLVRLFQLKSSEQRERVAVPGDGTPSPKRSKSMQV